MAAAQFPSAANLFGGRAMLGGGQLVRVEQRVLTAAVGVHGAPRDTHRDHDRNREDDEQHGDGEPAAGQLRPLLGDAEEQVVQPLREAFGQRCFRIDGLCEFTLGRLVGGVSVDIDGGHVRAAG